MRVRGSLYVMAMVLAIILLRGDTQKVTAVILGLIAISLAEIIGELVALQHVLAGIYKSWEKDHGQK